MVGGQPTIATFARALLGDDLPIAVEAYDGSRHGPAPATTRLVVRTPDALRHVVTAPGELGLARAYVAGDLDVEGDIFEVLSLRDRLPNPKLTPTQWALAARLLAGAGLRRPTVPPEEARVRGRLHSRRRDATAVTHHYDVSNAFYRLVLGPSMTYSCALFPDERSTLEEAQEAKTDLVCRKLGLRPGLRLLDVGCGWGSLVLHAARDYGVSAVGVTLSGEQAELARRRVAAAGLGDRVEIRVQDYREVADGPFDAISSVGMFEHVGRARAAAYFVHLHGLLAPGGRLLNQAIARPPAKRTRVPSRSFVGRYVFPDGEMLEVGDTVSLLQAAGFEARHVESLREHYARTLRAWVASLEASWDAAVAEVGVARARVWRLYMAGCALGFEAGRTSVHQVLAVRPTTTGESHLPARPDWEVRTTPASAPEVVPAPARR
ncbi:MAG: class I SAM-dependent methyltransferase [Acidimicrobiia bacterium]|nr:class I SAM-dependent methyltransferase [Acidimicrobiia bacterium]